MTFRGWGFYAIDWDMQCFIKLENLYEPLLMTIVSSGIYLPIIINNQNYSKLAQISQQPAEFEFPRKELPGCFHFTGPYHYSNSVSRESIPFPYEKLTGQPLIYASLGTLQNRLVWVFQTIAEACMGLDAQLIITLGLGS